MRMRFCPRRAAKGREDLAAMFFTTKGHEGTRSLAAMGVCRMASRFFVALGREGGRIARVRAHYVYSAIAFFAVTLSLLRWMVGGDGVSAAKHRGEKVWDFFKFYRGGVKILPRYRNYTTMVP